MKFRSLRDKLLNGGPLFAVLIDPDKYDPGVIRAAGNHKVSCFLVGGSGLKKGDSHLTVKAIRKISDIPVVLFPGDETQLSPLADGLLLLSLLSGRNPEYLIGKHVKAAPLIRKMKLSHIPVAYLLIGGGGKSATEQVTHTEPLRVSDIATIINTAMAAEQLGFSAVYLEGGSGSSKPVDAAIISRLKKTVSLPLIVGGGLTSPAAVAAAVKAGAAMVVVGNALEADIALLPELSEAFYNASRRRMR